jgi:hypothetical protein
VNVPHVARAVDVIVLFHVWIAHIVSRETPPQVSKELLRFLNAPSTRGERAGQGPEIDGSGAPGPRMNAVHLVRQLGLWV